MSTSFSPLKYFTVDAFTSTAFSGNPAAVILLPGERPFPEDTLLQKIAAEFNYAETAYIRKKPSSSSNEYELRWFTPVKEVKLCGHATLASAYVMKNHPELLQSPLSNNVIFHTLSGELIVEFPGSNGQMLMDFPADSAAQVQPTVTREAVAKAIGVSEEDVVHTEVSTHCGYAVVEVADTVDLSSLAVDSEALAKLFPDNSAQGVTNMSKGGKIVCRVFASAAGIPEDPVTGSMYTVLGPYWAQKTGRNSFQARQCSKRGGDVTVEVGRDRVVVGGYGTQVMEGILRF